MVRGPLQDHLRRAGLGFHLQKSHAWRNTTCSLSAQLAGLHLAWEDSMESVLPNLAQGKITELVLVQFCPLITKALGCNVGLTHSTPVPEHTSGSTLLCYCWEK